MPNVSQIAPLELIRLEEIPEAGSKELSRISDERQGLQLGASANAAISFIIATVIILGGPPVEILATLVAIAAVFAYGAASEFYKLCFGPKAWQLLPRGMTVASAQIEDAARSDTVAWNAEALAWNAAFAAWSADAEAWAGRKDSPAVARHLRERLSALFHERKALMHRRETIEMKVAHIRQLLDAAAGENQRHLNPGDNSINKDP